MSWRSVARKPCRQGRVTWSTFHSPDWRICPGMAWCPSQPGLGGSWPPARREGQGDAVLLDVGAGGGVRNGQPQHGHGADIAADGYFDGGFLAGPAWVRAVAIEPGCEQSRWLPVAADERCPDVPPEDRGAVVATTGIAAGQAPAVLAEPVPQGGAAGSGQRVRADPDHAAGAVAADLAVFEEK